MCISRDRREHHKFSHPDTHSSIPHRRTTAECLGPQAYTGVSGGVDHEKAIISYLNGKVGGIMFWAVNEGARAPNGKTTGENSIALANYAAAL